MGFYEESGTSRTPRSTPTPTPTGTPGPTIFWDGFEYGDVVGWTTSGIANVMYDAQEAYEGTHYVYTKYTSSMETSVSTSGYTSIHLKYAGKTNGFDSGEYLTCEWYDGSDWHIAAQFTSGSWSARDVALPSGASNNPNFKI